jgi:DNA repair protein RecN (Recombination protein N)
MSEVGDALMDMHQQFETLEIQQVREQYQVLDAYGGIQTQRFIYQDAFDRYTRLVSQLATLRERQASAIKEKDYLTFQLSEFDTIQMDPAGIAAMEEEYQLQSGAEEIKSLLATTIESLSGERGLTDQLRTHIRTISKHAQGNSSLTGFVHKLQALMDEYLDLCKEMTVFEEKLEPDPRRRQELEQKLNILNRIMLKHGARDANELILKHQEILSSLEQWANLDSEIDAIEKEIGTIRQSLTKQAKEISTARRKWAPKLAELVSTGLHDLSMKHAVLHIEVSDSAELHSYGKDNVEFLFAPNLGSEPKPVKKVASGGELSRLNLCLKSAVSDQMQMPTLVFDEIDAGVSGEVALRMGQKLKTLSKNHQVIMITHSPQIAAQAGYHLQVTKSDASGKSIARIHPLLPEERITEIAKMLSGDPPTKAAMMNAKTLIKT